MAVADTGIGSNFGVARHHNPMRQRVIRKAIPSQQVGLKKNGSRENWSRFTFGDWLLMKAERTQFTATRLNSTISASGCKALTAASTVFVSSNA